MKMPVGCLGDGSNLSSAGSTANMNNMAMDTILTSAALNAAEQFAFMQQTLLLQIFRIQQPIHTTNGLKMKNNNNNISAHYDSPLSSSNGRNSSHSSGESSSSSSSNQSSTGLLVCPTCIAFSDTCCQTDNGGEIFQDFIEANLHCYWDVKLSEALANLR